MCSSDLIWSARAESLRLKSEVSATTKIAREVQSMQEESDKLLHQARFLQDKKHTEPVLVARDGSCVVECRGCRLWRNSPRVAEDDWHRWLGAQDSARNRQVTENRLRHGVALIDCQMHTPHLQSLGAATIDRASFLEQIGSLIHCNGVGLTDPALHQGFGAGSWRDEPDANLLIQPGISGPCRN